MRKEVYICDRCKKVFHSSDPYVLDVPYILKLETITVQDQLEWHYCSDCWKVIKYRLTDDSESIEEKRLKEENERLRNTVDWWNSIFILAANDAIKQEKEKRDARSAACCCENTDKQTTAPYSSLR